MLNKFFKLDWMLVGAVVLLVGISVAIMYSLSSGASGWSNDIFLKQAVFTGLGVFAMFFFALTDYHYLVSYSRKIYFITIIILLGVALWGVRVRGTSGWIGFGPFSVQPVEFAKLAMIIFLSSFISKKKNELSEVARLVGSLVFTAIVAFLIIRQPDLGSALVVIAIWIGIILISGISKKSFLWLFLTGMLIVGSSWFILADYQKARIMTVFDTGADPRGSGYNVIQSIVAVGSGGILGKGIGHGSQSQLNFLPERHTDFIFAVITEELGILGAFAVLLLYLVIFFRLRRIATSAQDNFGYLFVSGVMVMLFTQLLINIGMNIGIVPVTGIPLPLLSYGGSSLLSVLCSIGIVLNIGSKGESLNIG